MDLLNFSFFDFVRAFGDFKVTFVGDKDLVNEKPRLSEVLKRSDLNMLLSCIEVNVGNIGL